MLVALKKAQRAGLPEAEWPPRPWMARFPSWIIRVGSKEKNNIRYPGHPINSVTLRQIFALALTGMPCRQIALWLNERIDRYPTFGTFHNRREKWCEDFIGK